MKSPKRIALVFGIVIFLTAVIAGLYIFQDDVMNAFFPEEDIAMETFDPYDDWLPFAIENPVQELSWLAPYSQSPQEDGLDSEKQQTNISGTDGESESYVSEDDSIPAGYPEKLVPVYEPEFFSQSGFNKDENSWFVYFDCSMPYHAAIDFYRGILSDKPHYSEDADADSIIFYCLLSEWSVKVKVCNFYDEHSCYIEIDLLSAQ